MTPSEGSVSLSLVGLDDYLERLDSLDTDHFVVARLNEDSEDIFLLYNRAKGINSGVRGSADKVRIIYN